MASRIPGTDPNWERLLAEIEDVLVSMPPREALGSGDDEALAWIGRAAAALGRWDFTKIPAIDGAAREAEAIDTAKHARGVTTLRTLLHSARADLRMEVGALSVVVPEGRVFDYFDEVRKVLAGAQTEVFCVDPYLNTEFISRYLPHVTAGIPIRLLAAKKVADLLSAVDVFARQNGTTISVRSSGKLHDRFVFVDRTACYVSGASFADGAKKSPVILTQITDAFPQTWAAYDALWQSAKVER